jgi:hypothetical protein
MATVPTGLLERELRKQYLRWLAGLPKQQDVAGYVDEFQRDSSRVIETLGGQAASLGALGDFPTPKLLPLSPRAGVIYSDMKQAAIQASIAAGLNAKDAARAMLRAGLDTNYKKLERLARTETVSAYWKNTWDSVDGLGLVMVWSAEEGPRTCDYCLSKDGMVVEERTIRDHPNGRCTLVPMLPSRVKYKGTVQPDGTVQKQAFSVAGPTASRPGNAAEVLGGTPVAPKPRSTQLVDGKDVPFEEAFAESLAKKLQDGEFTRAQLRAMAAQPGVKDLARANVAEALDRYAERTAVRPKSMASRVMPQLDAETIAALQPPAKFTEAVRNRALRALNATPNGKLIAEQLKKFQSGPRGAIARLRNDVEAYVSGSRALPQGRIDTIEAVLGGIRSSPVPAGVKLQRGMMIPGDFDSVMARYEAGDDLDLSISSFSSSRKKAEEFSRNSEGVKVSGRTTQMLVSIRGNAHALPVENLAPGQGGNAFRQEREWVASGRYKVVEVRRDVDSYGNPMVHVEIEEVSVW